MLNVLFLLCRTECFSAIVPLIPVTSCKVSINFPYFIEKECGRQGGKVTKLVGDGGDLNSKFYVSQSLHSFYNASILFETDEQNVLY